MENRSALCKKRTEAKKIIVQRLMTSRYGEASFRGTLVLFSDENDYFLPAFELISHIRLQLSLPDI